MAQTSKRLKLEGDPYSKFVQAVGKFGRNETSTIVHGTITNPPPTIKMMLDNDPIEYDAGDIFVAEQLTTHQRIATISSILVTLPMSTEGYSPHTHQIENITIKDAIVKFTDELAVGDRVLVECDDENMKFTIIDRVVSYK